MLVKVKNYYDHTIEFYSFSAEEWFAHNAGLANLLNFI